MSWWAMVYGELKMSAHDEKKWRAMTVEPAGWDDWPEELPVEGYEPVEVGETLDELADTGEKDVWLKVERKGDTLLVVGMLHEDAYRDFEIQLVTVFRAAAKAGASGDVVLSDDQMIDFVWRVKVNPKGSTVEAFDPQEARKNVFPKAIQAVMGAVPK